MKPTIDDAKPYIVHTGEAYVHNKKAHSYRVEDYTPVNHITIDYVAYIRHKLKEGKLIDSKDKKYRDKLHDVSHHIKSNNKAA